MTRLMKIILMTTAITLLFFASASLSASAAPNVVFISADGTGDGSSPNKPLGNASGYKTADGTDKQNAFYRGLEKLKNTGGTVVIVGDVIIDTSGARVPKSTNDTYVPSEFRVPQMKDSLFVTITSTYNGVDYGKKGAKLVIDYEKCNTSTIFFDCPTTIDNLNIEYRYHPYINNSWNTPFILGGGGHSLTIGKNVSVTSFNTQSNSEGRVYPILIGGHRYADVNKTSLTVRSGTWSTVIAGSFGLMSDTTVYGTVGGDATLNIEGGKIETVLGTGSLRNPSSTVKGHLTMNATGGDIGDFYICHDYAFDGKSIKVTLEGNTKIESFFYAPESYFGSLEALEQKVSIRNKTSTVIVPPSKQNEQAQGQEQTPGAETAPPTQNESTAPQKPTVNENTSTIFEMLDDENYKYIHPTILKWVIIVSCVIALGFGAKYLLKMYIVKH